MKKLKSNYKEKNMRKLGQGQKTSIFKEENEVKIDDFSENTLIKDEIRKITPSH